MVVESEFKSPNEWKDFFRYVVYSNRYVLNKKWQNFIKAILLTAKRRETTIEKETTLVRARIGLREEERQTESGDWEIDVGPLSPNDLIAPPSDNAEEGRINPRGISYLYLANDTATAIAEVRPWLKESVSVGYFKLTKNLKFVDTSRDKQRHFIYVGPKKHVYTTEEKEAQVWGDINYSFSKPVTLETKYRDYIATQYLSECFKVSGYDGIIYKSSLTTKGYNIVLFNPKVATLCWAESYEIDSLKYEFSQNSNPYWIKTKVTGKK